MEDIDRMVDVKAERRSLQELPEGDVCKLQIGYAFFSVSICSSNCRYELYKLDCNELERILGNHPLASKIAGFFHFRFIRL